MHYLSCNISVTSRQFCFAGKKIQVVQLFGQVFAYTLKMGNQFPKLRDFEKTTLVSHLLRSAILRSEYVYLNAKSRSDSSWGAQVFFIHDVRQTNSLAVNLRTYNIDQRLCAKFICIAESAHRRPATFARMFSRDRC